MPIKLLNREEALKRIRWLVDRRRQTLGTVSFKDFDVMNLRTVLELAEIGLKVVQARQLAAEKFATGASMASLFLHEVQERQPGATISEALALSEYQEAYGPFPSPQL